MKVITIESSAYQAMMEQIAEIAGYVRKEQEEKRRQEAANKECLLNTAQAAELLNVSTRTLQRMRDDHRIEYVIVRGTCRYRLSEVQRLLETNTVRNKEETIDALFHNYSLRTGGKKTDKGRRK
ncbi:helix-turn-helix domain-containing protein [Parabacteroides timonensis]|uniref:helix-turn-helix domain-containing protein n=1 Tax=Parabacteroides timonensis TaxID=1871013 RepID=UPI00094F05B2|nr:helix-turn-helix domain-containing protein [Parabacteroides timonensis]